MLGWCIFAWICSSVLNFSIIFFCSTFALTTLRANTSDVLFDRPSKQTANPPFPSFLPVMYVSGDEPGSVMETGGLHLSSMRSGLVGFSSGLGFDSSFGLLVALGGAIGRFADRGERTSISDGAVYRGQKCICCRPVVGRAAKCWYCSLNHGRRSSEMTCDQDEKRPKVNID